MPVHREKVRKPVGSRDGSEDPSRRGSQEESAGGGRTARRETSTQRKAPDGERPIITQEKAKVRKPEATRRRGNEEAKPSSRREATTLKDVLEKRIKKAGEGKDVRPVRVSQRREDAGRREAPQRSRTRTRTLSPTEVKQLTREKMARDAIRKKEEEEEVETVKGGESEQKQKQKEEEEEEEEEVYEDDFEDYESDFEEDSEEEPEQEEKEEVVAPPPEPTPKSASQRRELEEIKQAMRMEMEELTVRRKSTPEVAEEVTHVHNFPKPRKKLEADAVADRVRKRGRDLLSMITLDSMSYSFLELPSVPYDVYMKIYGRSDTKQVHVQTNEDDLDEETQTEVIEVRSKWVQKPPAAGGAKNFRLTKEERLGVGGDDVIDPEPAIEVVDTTRLSNFLTWASDLVLPVLEAKSGNYLGMDKLPNRSEEMTFSDGYVVLNVADVPLLKDKSVSDVNCSRSDVGTLLSVHTDPNVPFSDSVICEWNIRDLSKPMKVLTASNRVTSVCSECQGLVFAGLVDGTVCLWDLKESSALHQSTIRDGWVFRSPTYTTAQISHGHLSPVVSVRALRETGDLQTGDFTPVQVCTLEETGNIIIWSVVQGRNLSEDDLGLAHWGTVKLVKSSAFSVCAALGKDLPLYVTCTDLALDQRGDVEMYVTSSLGDVAHVSKYGTVMKPKAYGGGDHVETTCIEMCPFDRNYFLAGCKDGSIRLHCRSQELPLITLSGIVEEDGPQASIVSLAWLFVRPFVFFALDSLSRIHIWDLGLSDMYPEVTLALTKRKISCLRLVQSDSARGRPLLVMATSGGRIEVHRLRDEYGSRSSGEIHKDVKKFLKYVSIL